MRTVTRPPIVALTVALIVALLAGTALLALAWRFEVAVAAPVRSASDAALVARGARLAALGNCGGCHTVDGGLPYAGGVPLATPFGTIVGTNITPDVDTGIGAWSETAFVRAMREGLDRDGRHLYPAFPYDHFTRLGDDDLHALYTFLMTRDPVAMPAPTNDLAWPLRWRGLVTGWNLLYLHPPGDRSAVAAAESSTSPAHGAYLADALAHCGACHTPRNALGAERADRAYGGGMAEGWYAPPLDADSPSPIPWTVDAMTTYLRTGLVADHAMAGGPMQGVVANLADADEADVRAIATSVVATIGPTTPDRMRRADGARERAATPLAARADAAGDDATMRLGATVYATACARCHDAGREVGSGGALQMPLAVALYDADPRSFLRIVREGIEPPDAATGRWMPAFGTSLSDAQLAGLAAWLRRTAAEAPPWPDLSKAVAQTRAVDVASGRAR